MAVATRSVIRDLPRRQGGRARAGAGRLRDQGPRAAGDRRRARGAHARDPRGQRARPRGRPRVRPVRRADGPPGARRARASAAMAAGVREIVALPDPVGEVLDGFRLPNGLDVRKVRVPLGVVAVVYEARPNVTIDAAALALKSGNAIVLRGSSSATHSNAVLAAVAAEAAEAAGLPGGRARRWWPAAGARSSPSWRRQEGVVDLIIPRGGEGLKAALSAVAKVPVIYAASGNCHVYVDAAADLDVAREIIVNAKVQRPGVCNAAETLLVHADVADAFLPGRPGGAARRRRRAARRRARAGRRRRRRRGHRGGLGDRVPRARARRAGRRLGRRGDRAHRRLRLRPLRGDRHRLGGRRAAFQPASTPPASTSTPRRASPTAASSAWAPRSATPRRSCTPAARSACASCAPSSTWSRATARSAP